ncbi:MAG: TIGR04084 family radical SAM/SPASM domain-containing protein [Candidatus Bathyarchaeota archaeon]|nr:TIGR04084 family radical SAM/SPASM domain-containing protein [Candidatus Bathyarchaeota archaeon]
MLTTECNLQCKYCFGEAVNDFEEDFSGLDVDYSLPKKASYAWSQLAKFCSKDADCVLTFYGGEPLLCINEIKQIMDLAKPKQFMIQTNGLLLDKLEPEYVNRFHTILVSIDGDEALTDYYRGKGTFRKVVNNLRLITQNGFQGELIARMTVMEQTDLYKQVTWLLDNTEFAFSSVHWQLNAGFWEKDYARRDFKRWSENSYIPSLKQLAQFWVNQMQTKSTMLKLYPLLGIAHSLLHKEPSLLRCGSGWINYTIQTDGTIIPCPTMWGMKNYYISHIRNAHPKKLKQILIKNEPCTDCEVFSICGGRCLYANVTKRWSSEAYALVCNTVKSLVDAVDSELPRIRQLINNGTMRLSDFDFVKYNGCEIIP